MPLPSDVFALETEPVALCRDLHQHPELAYHWDAHRRGGGRLPGRSWLRAPHRRGRHRWHPGRSPGGRHGRRRLAVGIHLWNHPPVDTIGVKVGPLMTPVDCLHIATREGGHAAMPHGAADSLVAAAHVISKLQTIVSRETAPAQAAVVTIASIRGGDAVNVILDQGVLSGTIRTFDTELCRSMPERVASALECRADIEVLQGNPAVINHAHVTDLCRRAAGRAAGQAVSP